MVAQVVAIFTLILSHGRREFFPLGQTALWVAVAAALVSAADYFRRFNLFVGPRSADLRPPGDRRASDRKVG